MSRKNSNAFGNNIASTLFERGGIIVRIQFGSAFTTLLLSYLAVFLLPLALGSVLYTKTKTIMTKHASRANYAMLEQLRDVMDGKLRNVERMSEQLAFNSRLQWLMSNPDIAGTPEAYKFVEFMADHLARFQNMSDLVRDYYIYIKENDTVLLPKAKTTADVLYHRLYRPLHVSFGDWRRELTASPHYKDYAPASYETPTGTVDTITYVQTLPVGELSEIRGALVLMLDMGHIRSMLENIEAAYDSSVLILDHQDRLIAGDRELALPWDRIRGGAPTQGMPYEYEDEGEQRMLTYTVSEQNGWKYILVMPKQVYFAKVRTLEQTTLSLLLIGLFGGAAAIGFWLHRNYAPLRDTVRALQRAKPAAEARTANEYEFIRETIRMTMREERELRTTLSLQTPVIQANFLSRFIRGHVDPGRITDDSLQFMNIRLISEHFAVVLIDIADFSRFSSDPSERQRALIRFIVSNVGSDLIRERHWGYAVELDQSRVALLVNFDAGRLPEALRDLDEIAVRLKQVIEGRFKTVIAIAIGDVHEGASGAYESYLEALGALDYKMYRGQDAIIRFAEIADADRHYYYPIETEIQLINFTKSGDVEHVDQLIGSIFHAHFEQRRITPELGRSLFHNMVSTLWKIINPMDPLYREVFGERFDPIGSLSACATVEDMKILVREWFLTLCNYLNASRSPHSRQLSERIAHFIRQHYGDDRLSLTMIAEHFQLTPQYLSAFFKKQTGMNLSDYIAKVRIEQAKRLMQDKTLTFAQIASKVGYASDIGFIRVFKKYEGTTPGKYRESL